MKIKTLAVLSGLLLSHTVLAQPATPRQLPARRTTRSVKIDGLLNDEAWKDAAMATRFVEFRPRVGAPEDTATRTETWLMYNDEGIYFGGFCYERSKDSIATELSGRDGFGTNDYVGIIFDTYKDKLNGFEYFITPLGEQWDAKIAPNTNGNMEDFSWNAVWQSGAVVHENGWSFEFFIPYAAIRFGKKNIQDWGLNITRRRQKSGQQFMWNPVDPNVNGFLTQEGYWTGITDIKPPLRLQFSPYFSVYANHYSGGGPGQKKLTTQVNGGMDLKYGINQAFTLDATLIPDFGQVQSDNQVLNLTPFEVRFNENRTFFTEGTELFSKGNLFYSRRIGGTPLHRYDVQGTLGADERIVRNPTESKLINASKISGRTQKGLGIGVLNAVTQAQYATVENTRTGEERRVQTDPLTNYSLVVLDQTMKHNSSISLVNTNVWRSGADYDANVTAALFDLNDKKNTWNVGGKMALSHLAGLPAGKNTTGYSQGLYFGKTSGRFNFNVWQDLTDTRFTSNDLGFFTNNNYLDHGVWAGYKWLEPRKWYNRIFLNFNARVSRLFSRIAPVDTRFQTAGGGASISVQSKKLWWTGGFLEANLAENDFYEPRVPGKVFRRGANVTLGSFFNSNEAKKYSFSADVMATRFIRFYEGLGLNLTLAQNYRFSSKFSVNHRISLQPRYNNVGFTDVINPENIVFARRNRYTTENILFLKYNFTNKMGLTFRMRHYLSAVENKSFYRLQPGGGLTPHESFNQPRDQNVNFFNIDMVYTWQFAQGSFINIVWKDAAFHYAAERERNYFKNFGNTIESDQNNNISLRVIYFLDYGDWRKSRKKNKS